MAVPITKLAKRFSAKAAGRAGTIYRLLDELREAYSELDEARDMLSRSEQATEEWKEHSEQVAERWKERYSRAHQGQVIEGIKSAAYKNTVLGRAPRPTTFEPAYQTARQSADDAIRRFERQDAAEVPGANEPSPDSANLGSPGRQAGVETSFLSARPAAYPKPTDHPVTHEHLVNELLGRPPSKMPAQRRPLRERTVQAQRPRDSRLPPPRLAKTLPATDWPQTAERPQPPRPAETTREEAPEEESIAAIGALFGQEADGGPETISDARQDRDFSSAILATGGSPGPPTAGQPDAAVGPSEDTSPASATSGPRGAAAPAGPVVPEPARQPTHRERVAPVPPGFEFDPKLSGRENFERLDQSLKEGVALAASEFSTPKWRELPGGVFVVNTESLPGVPIRSIAPQDTAERRMPNVLPPKQESLHWKELPGGVFLVPFWESEIAAEEAKHKARRQAETVVPTAWPTRIAPVASSFPSDFWVMVPTFGEVAAEAERYAEQFGVSIRDVRMEPLPPDPRLANRYWYEGDTFFWQSKASRRQIYHETGHALDDKLQEMGIKTEEAMEAAGVDFESISPYIEQLTRHYGKSPLATRALLEYHRDKPREWFALVMEGGSEPMRELRHRLIEELNRRGANMAEPEEPRPPGEAAPQPMGSMVFEGDKIHEGASDPFTGIAEMLEGKGPPTVGVGGIVAEAIRVTMPQDEGIRRMRGEKPFVPPEPPEQPQSFATLTPPDRGVPQKTDYEFPLEKGGPWESTLAKPEEPRRQDAQDTKQTHKKSKEFKAAYLEASSLPGPTFDGVQVPAGSGYAVATQPPTLSAMPGSGVEGRLLQMEEELSEHRNQTSDALNQLDQKPSTYSYP